MDSGYTSLWFKKQPILKAEGRKCTLVSLAKSCIIQLRNVYDPRKQPLNFLPKPADGLKAI